MRRTLSLVLVASAVLAGCSQQSEQAAVKPMAAQKKADLPIPLDSPKALLGSQLFFDTNLSKHRNESCASCHDSARAFSDGRTGGALGAVSLGSDNLSTGDRNAPMASYSALTPKFHQTSEGIYRGGQFLDGRATDLATQAAGPFLNPVEMQMPNEAAVVDRVLENKQYETSIKRIYGEHIFDDKAQAYAAVTDAIAHFEQTKLFMPFDSKYDRVMRGEDSFTAQEELGRTLFFSQQFTNCNACHQLNPSPFFERETFTNYEYRNIGVPANPDLHLAKADIGLLNNPAVNDEAEKGKFRVPSLRNVAVTGPYMHNGVFKDLRTVVLFYDKYNNPQRTTNPETGKPWAEPEVAETIDQETLAIGPALDEQRVNAIVAFLKTLTDKQYEHLVK